MTTFRDVFFTTLKVLLALFLISVGAGVIYFFIVGAIGISTRGTRESDARKKQYSEQQADAASSKVPRSQWEREIKRCIDQHTVVEGMTRDEVRRAVGGDPSRAYSKVTLKGTDQACIRYAGEQCAEYPPDQVKTFNLHFTPKGNLIWDDDSIGLSVYSKQASLLSSPPPENAGSSQADYGPDEIVMKTGVVEEAGLWAKIKGASETCDERGPCWYYVAFRPSTETPWSLNWYGENPPFKNGQCYVMRIQKASGRWMTEEQSKEHLPKILNYELTSAQACGNGQRNPTS